MQDKFNTRLNERRRKRSRFYKTIVIVCILAAVLGLICNAFWTLLLYLNFSDNILNEKKAHECHCQDGPDFQWLRDRNFLSAFVDTSRDTALIFPRSTPLNWFLYFGKEIVKSYRREVACFVFSSPNNFGVRDAIRQSWGKYAEPIFMMGKTNDESTMNLLISESKIHKDIIVEDFVDSHLNQTLKTAFALKNFLIRYRKSKFFLKTEDDVFLNITNLAGVLQTAEPGALIGLRKEGEEVDRNSKSRIFVPDFLYSDPRYPPHLSSTAYIIPRELVKRIYEASMTTPFFNIENAFFIGLVAVQTLKLKLQDDPRFKLRPYNDRDLCAFKNFITANGLKTYKLVNLWNLLSKSKSC